MASVLPTKGNLLGAKRSRELAITGFELMDKKRNVLIREIMALIGEAEALQSQIEVTFAEAYESLRIANITLGKSDRLAESVRPDSSLALRYRSVMGVEIPTVLAEKRLLDISFGFIDSNSALDNAFIKFNKAKELIQELATLENTIYRLAYSIKKTQKRANALKNIVIPGFNATIKMITDYLEEKDREEFVRLKVIKQQHG